MKLSVASFFAGLFGALAAVFILLSFGTDYWLLASESCHPNPSRAFDLAVAIQVGVRVTIEWFQFEILPPLPVASTTSLTRNNSCYFIFLEISRF